VVGQFAKSAARLLAVAGLLFRSAKSPLDVLPPMELEFFTGWVSVSRTGGKIP